jgi:hypothetical protein
MTARQQAYLRAVEALLDLRPSDAIADTLDRITLARELLARMGNERK